MIILGIIVSVIVIALLLQICANQVKLAELLKIIYKEIRSKYETNN